MMNNKKITDMNDNVSDDFRSKYRSFTLIFIFLGIDLALLCVFGFIPESLGKKWVYYSDTICSFLVACTAYAAYRKGSSSALIIVMTTFPVLFLIGSVFYALYEVGLFVFL